MLPIAGTRELSWRNRLQIKSLDIKATVMNSPTNQLFDHSCKPNASSKLDVMDAQCEWRGSFAATGGRKTLVSTNGQVNVPGRKMDGLPA